MSGREVTAWPDVEPDPTDEACCPTPEAAAANLCGCRGNGTRIPHHTTEDYYA